MATSRKPSTLSEGSELAFVDSCSLRGMWLRNEPPVHHVALPWQALLSLLSTALLWGWTRVAGVLALSWGAITRNGEVLNAARQNLILPSDIGETGGFAVLEIGEAKTRFRSARHQPARIDQPQLLRVVCLAFAKLCPQQKLWPMSGSTIRNTALRDFLRLQAWMTSLTGFAEAWIWEVCELAERPGF